MKKGKVKPPAGQKRSKKSPVVPQQQQRNVKDMSSEELGLLLGQECSRIIQAQGIIQEAQTNVNNLRAELEIRQKKNMKESENDGKKR